MALDIKDKLLIIVCGPTAAGKTDVAIRLAERHHTEVISADSRQFYKEMDAATAKPDKTQLERVRHHFINSRSIFEDYDVGRFEQDALALIEERFTEKDVLIACGGSGLYLRALSHGLDQFPSIPAELSGKLDTEYQAAGLQPLLAELLEKDPAYYHLVDRDNPQRILRALSVIRSTGRSFSSFRTGAGQQRPFRHLYLQIGMARELLYERINRRVDSFFAAGLIEECRRLHPHRHLNALRTVGYTEVFNYFDGLYDQETCRLKICQHTRNYAKRQETWLRKYAGGPIFTPSDDRDMHRYIDGRE